VTAWRAAAGAQLAGELAVPGDKSISHRSLLLGGLAEGVTEVRGFLRSEDCLATLQALRQLGIRIDEPGDGRLQVHGGGANGLHGAGVPLDMGNAGTAMRLFMGVLAGRAFNSELIGDRSLMKRPMERVATPLRQMGARIHTVDGRPPVRIQGGAILRGIDYSLPVASAQVKSAVLLAALAAHGPTSITEPAVTRDHTEQMLRAFGVRIEQRGLTVRMAGQQPLRGTQISVPGDFSSAAFFIVAALLAAPQGLTIRGVGLNPTRTGLLEILRLMGADIEVRQTSTGGEIIGDIQVRQSRLRGVRVPESLVSLAIDEFPVLFVAAACAEGETVVSGAAELRVKESDRLAVMAEGLNRLGVRCQLAADGLTVRGGAMTGGKIDSHGDHRIAMSFAVASLRAAGAIDIDDVANVATSFPDFVGLAHSVGFAIDRVS
jgi:3-phosphoshikimate 1-carboxyvinyltransferase